MEEECYAQIRGILLSIDRMDYYVKSQNYYQAVVNINDIFWHFSVLFEHLPYCMDKINEGCMTINMADFVELFYELERCFKEKDYILFSDICTLKLTPILHLLEEILWNIAGIIIREAAVVKNFNLFRKGNEMLIHMLFSDEQIKVLEKGLPLREDFMREMYSFVEQCEEKEYRIEPTACGTYTLCIKENHYLHTNNSIGREAILQAKEWLSQGKMMYTFFGLGLGYPYSEMALMNPFVQVQIIEPNEDIILLSMLFSNLGHAFSEKEDNFRLIYDPNGEKLSKLSFEITEEKGSYIYYPALNTVKDVKLREMLETYFMNESSVRTFGKMMDTNFRWNVKEPFWGIDRLEEHLKGQDVIFVAAGPSLEKNLPVLKQKYKGKIIIAVGTVLKLLLKEGLVPDYVAVADSGLPLYNHIQGVEDCGVPLIFLSSACSKVVKNYQAEKYMLCQEGFFPAEKLAEKRHWKLVSSGGSVATMVFDLLLRLGVRKIICVGLDLAYTGEKAHAAGSEGGMEAAETDIYVDAVHGGKVRTGKTLKIYLDWFQKRMRERTEEEKQILVIDATEGGAKKEGMEIMTLSEALS